MPVIAASVYDDRGDILDSEKRFITAFYLYTRKIREKLQELREQCESRVISESKFIQNYYNISVKLS